MDFTIEEYNEEVRLTIIEETDTLEFSIEETVEELNLVIEEYHGADGAKGEKPNHQWSGTSLRFENPDDTWGDYVDLKGDKGEDGGGLISVVAGDNITIDNTDPLNPIINAEDGGTTVTKTSDIINDGEDGINPYISLNDIPVVDVSTKAETDASNLTSTNVISWRDALDIYSKSQVDVALTGKLDKPTTDGSNADVLVKDSAEEGGVKWSNRLTTAETAITAINGRTSSVVDKMLHYWDATAVKWFSSGVEFISNGILKVKSIILTTNTGTALPDELGFDGVNVFFGNTKRKLAFKDDIFEHNVRGKRVEATISGTYAIDLNAGSHFSLTATTATTISFSNIILADETCSISMTVTGELLTMPAWLIRDSTSDIPDATKTREYTIIIKKGGVSPSGRFNVINM